MLNAITSLDVPGAGASAKASAQFCQSYKSSKQTSSVLPHQHNDGETTVPNRDKDAGNFSGNTDRPRAFRVTQAEWRKLSSQAFRDHVGDRPGGAKAIAEVVECSPKTAQSWLDGESTPAGILDLRAMSAVPVYAALKREIAAMELGLDPRLQAKYQELHRLTLQLGGLMP